MKLLIVDGSHLLFRAWFGSYTMRKNGKENACVSLYLNMVDKALRAVEPDQVVFIFDCSEPNFRHQLLPTYKANRPKRDEGMKVEESIIHELLVARGFCVLRVPGIEGDDLAGTIAVQHASVDKNSVVVYTGDKDYYQLVNDERQIALLNPSDQIVNESAVVEKTGVIPTKIVLYLALMGDAADNIIGVKGVGTVTAAKAVKNADNIEQAYDALGLPVKTDGIIERLKLNVKLTTICTNLPLNDLDFSIKPADAALQSLYGKYKIYNRWDFNTPPAI